MTEERDLVDAVLDRALALHGAGEPRPGIEGRVLAVLREKPPLPWWRALLAGNPGWAGLSGAALVGVAVALALVRGVRTGEVAVPGVVSLPSPTAAPARVPPSTTFAEEVPATVVARGARPSSPARVDTVARTSRRPSFPHRTPLSEEEELLLRYVSESPREEIEPRAGFLDAPAALPAIPDPATEP